MFLPDLLAPPRRGLVPDALAALRSGRPVLVLDNKAERTGDVLLSAAMAARPWTAWMVRHSSGLICAPMAAERAEQLDLPPMVAGTPRRNDAAYGITVDARHGVSTGISAADRARTATVLADSQTGPDDLTRPGHVLPLRARRGGVLERAGHTEAAVDLCRLAGLPPVALMATIVQDSGPVASPHAVAELGHRHDLVVLDLAQIATHRSYHGDGETPRVRRGMQTTIPTSHGSVRAVRYRDSITNAEHLALLGEPSPVSVPLAYIQTECVAGPLSSSLGCECSTRLDAALARVCTEGGVVVYLRQAHVDGVGAHTILPCDQAAAAAILSDLGMTTIRLLPGAATAAALRPGGISVLDIGPCTNTAPDSSPRKAAISC